MTLGTDILGLSCVDVGVYITLSEIQNLLVFHFLFFSSGVPYVAKQTEIRIHHYLPIKKIPALSLIY